MGERRDIYRKERGQALVLFALFLLVLMGMVALAADGGYAFAQRRRMQYAADAAAMAGARALALYNNTTAVENAVKKYALDNGADTYSWELVDGHTVRVQVSRTFSTFFAGVVGIDQMTATAVAEASIEGVSEMNNLLPIAVEEFDFEYGKIYKLWDKDSNPSPGNFGWLDWNGGSPSAVELANNICNPENSGTWKVGQWVPGAPGVKMSMAVRNCLNKWLNQAVTIIIYDTVKGPGNNSQYHIAGFARFVITGYNFKGSEKYILGRFERFVLPGEGGGPDFGVLALVLGDNDSGVNIAPEPVGTPVPSDDDDDHDDDKKGGDKDKTPEPTKAPTPTKVKETPEVPKPPKKGTPEPTIAPSPTSTPEATPTISPTPTPCEDEKDSGDKSSGDKDKGDGDDHGDDKDKGDGDDHGDDKDKGDGDDHGDDKDKGDGDDHGDDKDKGDGDDHGDDKDKGDGDDHGDDKDKGDGDDHGDDKDKGDGDDHGDDKDKGDGDDHGDDKDKGDGDDHGDDKDKGDGDDHGDDKDKGDGDDHGDDKDKGDGDESPTPEPPSSSPCDEARRAKDATASGKGSGPDIPGLTTVEMDLSRTRVLA